MTKIGAFSLVFWGNPESPHPEIPQQLGLDEDYEPERLIGKMSMVLGCNPEVLQENL